jgi:hypothetical protein
VKKIDFCKSNGSSPPDGTSSGMKVTDERNKLFDNSIRFEWLTSKEAAAYLRMSEKALWHLIYSDQLDRHYIGKTRSVRFHIDELKALLNKRKGEQ